MSATANSGLRDAVLRSLGGGSGPVEDGLRDAVLASLGGSYVAGGPGGIPGAKEGLPAQPTPQDPWSMGAPVFDAPEPKFDPQTIKSMLAFKQNVKAMGGDIDGKSDAEVFGLMQRFNQTGGNEITANDQTTTPGDEFERGLRRGVAYGLPAGLPGVVAMRENEQVQRAPEGFAGFAGQTLGGFAGLLDPGQAPANFGAIVFTGGVGRMLAGPVELVGKRVAESLGAEAGARAVNMIREAVENAGQGGGMAALNEIGQIPADDWTNKPVESVWRVVKAAGVGAVAGGTLGAGFGAARKAVPVPRATLPERVFSGMLDADAAQAAQEGRQAMKDVRGVYSAAPRAGEMDPAVIAAARDADRMAMEQARASASAIESIPEPAREPTPVMEIPNGKERQGQGRQEGLLSQEQPAPEAKAPAVDSKMVPKKGAFDLLVQKDRQLVHGLLMNWNGSELTDADRIKWSDRRAGSGSMRESSKDFINWILSDEPFDPKKYEVDAEWRSDIERARSIVAEPAPVKSAVDSLSYTDLRKRAAALGVLDGGPKNKAALIERVTAAEAGSQAEVSPRVDTASTSKAARASEGPAPTREVPQTESSRQASDRSSPNPTRQPWEMTREEAGDVVVEAHRDRSPANPIYETLTALSDKLNGRGYIPEHISPERLARAKDDGFVSGGSKKPRLTEEGRRALYNLDQESKSRMMRRGAAFDDDMGVALDAHYAAVSKALSEGRPVPPEVLADYPDLAASAKPPTPAESGTTPAGTAVTPVEPPKASEKPTTPEAPPATVPPVEPKPQAPPTPPKSYDATKHPWEMTAKDMQPTPGGEWTLPNAKNRWRGEVEDASGNYIGDIWQHEAGWYNVVRPFNSGKNAPTADAYLPGNYGPNDFVKVGSQGVSTSQSVSRYRFRRPEERTKITDPRPNDSHPTPPKSPADAAPKPPDDIPPRRVVNTPEPGEPEGPITGIRHAMVDADRERLGINTWDGPEVRTRQASLDQAIARGINKRALDIAASVRAKPRLLNDIELAGMHHRMYEISKDIDAKIAERDRLPDGPDKDSVTTELDRLGSEFEAIADVTQKYGGEDIARTLSYRNAIIKEDFSIARMKYRAEKAKGSKLTPEESAKIETMSKQLEEANTRIAKLEADVESARAESTVKRHASTKRAMPKDAREKIIVDLAAKARALIDTGCR